MDELIFLALDSANRVVEDLTEAIKFANKRSDLSAQMLELILLRARSVRNDLATAKRTLEAHDD